MNQHDNWINLMMANSDQERLSSDTRRASHQKYPTRGRGPKHGGYSADSSPLHQPTASALTKEPMMEPT